MNRIKITLAGMLLALLFPVPGRAQRVETYTDPVTGEKYAAINAEELPRNVVVRKDNPDIMWMPTCINILLRARTAIPFWTDRAIRSS